MKKAQKISISVLTSLALVLFGATLIYPNLLIAQSDSSTITVNLTVDSGITITPSTDTVTMIPNIGISQDSSIGSSTLTVTTNDTDGYQLAVKASTNPALQSGSDQFDDYTEAVAGTPDAWSVDSGVYEFGFSGYGDDVEVEYGTASTCGSGGTPDASLNFEGFTTSDEVLAATTTVTSTSGTETVVCFAAEQNGVFAPSGAYSATITATATVQ